MCAALNIVTESLSDKYLGLPALVGIDRSDCFKHLIDRVRSKTKGWKEKLLSMGGKEILIKSIAQAVPVFTMMVFKIPKNICKGMTDAISQFWWGDDDDQRRIHWKAWWKLCIPKSRGGMGFRDLETFNRALLAKQVWRLLLEPESLCARVLRARYYPDGKLLNAKQKSGSSYTWQSILAGLDCFKKGYIWRVGDGSQINIWEDSWVPASHNLKVLTPRGHNLLTTVDELIDPVTGKWDEEMIKSMFWDIDANRILQIPLVQGREDVVAWHYNRKGYFSVGSAYHTQWLHKFGDNNVDLNAGSSGGERVWKTLWKLNVPAKIKIFGWRVLHGLLPCRGILANRHIGEDSSCPICRQGCEDIKHILFSCERSKEIWRVLGISEELNRLSDTDRSGSVLLADIIKQSKQIKHLNQVGLAELFLTGGWYVWWERRKQVHGDTVQNPAKSAMSIATLTTNYMKAEKKNIKIKTQWKRPPEDFLLLNVDASYNYERSTGSSGAVIRDARGVFVAAAAKYYENVLDAHMAEAMALREGMLLAYQVGCRRLMIQSDCAEVVETIHQGGLSATASAPIYNECAQIWQDFISISIEHCNRETNCVADELARMAMASNLTCNWVDEPPRNILEALVNDVTMFQGQ